MQEEERISGLRTKGRMQTIHEGLFEEHTPSAEGDQFTDAIYSLFEEFTDSYYKEEWRRLDENAAMYAGKHWENKANTGYENEHEGNYPKPSTPIITSTIENIKADLSDEFPEAVITPDMGFPDTLVVSKVLTHYIKEELDNSGFEKEYMPFAHDTVQDGWGVWEIGFDPTMNRGNGGSYIRYIINKNFLCDPEVMNIQDGRACFKIDKRPADWFRQRYPKQYEFMSDDFDTLLDKNHDTYESTTEPSSPSSYRLIEAWFRIFNPKTKRYAVHFVLLAGGQVLENSAVDYPNGYYAHGEYPFEIARLFPQKGSALGLGIVDLFKDVQKYADKLDQIMLMNAFRASRPRMFINEDMVEGSDVRDFSKEVIACKANPESAVKWMDTAPLPSYLMNYRQLLHQSIKNESGANDQSRGQTGSGVTAASAITALQEMSTKRSRMEAQAILYAFKDAVRLLIETIREKAIVPRMVTVTIRGETHTLPFDGRSLQEEIEDTTNMPIESYIDIKTARKTRYSKLTHNELYLQMLQMLGGTVDPVIMLEGLEFEDKENMLDTIRKAQEGGMLALQKQIAQMGQQMQQMAEQIETYKKTADSARAVIEQQKAARAKAAAQRQPQAQPQEQGAMQAAQQAALSQAQPMQQSQSAPQELAQRMM